MAAWCIHQSKATQSSAENMWRKPMSRQHAPCTDGCELRCINHADESTVIKISTQYQIDTNERIKLEASIHTCRKYKGTVRSICILHPITVKREREPVCARRGGDPTCCTDYLECTEKMQHDCNLSQF